MYKKVILAVLMVLMVVAPCLAETVPEGISSLHGTLWEETRMFFNPTPAITHIGFYGGKVYYQTAGRFVERK